MNHKALYFFLFILYTYLAVSIFLHVRISNNNWQNEGRFMNKFFLIIGTVLLAGCVTVPDETAAVGPGAGNFPKELKAGAQMWAGKPRMFKTEDRSPFDEK